MYIPYLHTKTFELLAIKELLQKDIIKENLVRPLLSTYSTRGLLSIVELFKNKKYPMFFVVNPDHKFSESYNTSDFDKIKELVYESDNCIIPTYCITNDIDNSEIEKMRKMRKIKEYAIIHGNPLPDNLEKDIENDNNVYRIYIDNNLENESKKDIEIVDGFVREERSDDYKKYSNFNSRLFSYKRRKLIGFGDYQTIGRKIQKGGIAPNFIVINIIYKDNKKLYIRHFKSDEENKHPTTDPLPMKFKSVYDIISKEIKKENGKYIITEGINQLLELKDHFPGLGKLKQFSIMHHIEFMQKELCDENINEKL